MKDASEKEIRAEVLRQKKIVLKGQFQRDEEDAVSIYLEDIEKVLSSQKLILDIPNYVNGRPTPINALLIKSALWLNLKSFMQLNEIHEVLIAFEIYCREKGSKNIPLKEKVI